MTGPEGGMSSLGKWRPDPREDLDSAVDAHHHAADAGQGFVVLRGGGEVHDRQGGAVDRHRSGDILRDAVHD